MRSLSFAVNDDTAVKLNESNTIVSVEIYNQTDALMRALTEADLQDNTPQCERDDVVVSLNIAKDAHAWLLSQQGSIEEILNNLIAQAMLSTSS